MVALNYNQGVLVHQILGVVVSEGPQVDTQMLIRRVSSLRGAEEVYAAVSQAITDGLLRHIHPDSGGSWLDITEKGKSFLTGFAS